MRRFVSHVRAAGAAAAVSSLIACSGAASPPASAPLQSSGVARTAATTARGPGIVETNGVVGAPAALGVPAPAVAGPNAGKAQLFVADQGNGRIDIFPLRGNNQKPTGSITSGIVGADGVFVDGKGTLYVCNFGAGTVTEYPKGKTAPSVTLTGAGSPKYVAVGTDGTVYVSNFGGSQNGQVLEYVGGATSPSKSITFQTFPAGLALDSHGRLYVAYNDQTNNDIEVLRFAHGSTKGTNLGIHLSGGYAGGATIDHKDNLIVANQAAQQVDVFPPGATSPSQQFSFTAGAYQVALNHGDDRLFVSSGYGKNVVEVTYPAGQAVNTISDTLSTAFGVAASPDGTF